MFIISYVLVSVALFFAVPVILFLVEVVAAIALPRREGQEIKDNNFRQRIAVLVPAHDESSGLLPTLADSKAQLRVADRLIVVADNCSDDTASVAAAAGAEVVERKDAARRGKGYALACGLDYLKADRPDIVIVIDADCRLGEQAIDRLARACVTMNGPVQALDLMISQSDSSLNFKVSEFAWRVKNQLRPLGLKALGLPCQLMGTGMAFPWDVIASVDLGSQAIVEDLKLGLELARLGHPPTFCPSATVTSAFPSCATAGRSQRLRWEQGHINLILMAAPRLILTALARANGRLLALVLDMAIPPLSLLATVVMVTTAIAGLAQVLGLSSAAAPIAAGSLVALIAGAFLSWLKVGRDILPLRSILLVAPYVIGKIPLYGLMLSGRAASQWTRTQRGKPEQKETTTIL